MRVRLDEQVAALGHSIFGCLVFTSLLLMVAMTGRQWTVQSKGRATRLIMFAAFIVPAVCLGQYGIGGVVRHFGGLLHEHVAGAVAVVIATFVALYASRRNGHDAVRRAGFRFSVAVVVQIIIGCAVWITKLGLPSAQLVAVQHSMPQILARSVHTVAGMAVVSTSILWGITVWRVSEPVQLFSTRLVSRSGIST